MKNQRLFQRFLNSLAGLKCAWVTENSFRTQVLITVLVLPVLFYLRPSALWWGVFLTIIGATLAAELFNTALEYLCDHLHPEFHPQIGMAKDCAAAAVLVLSLTSVFIFIVFVCERLDLIRFSHFS